MVPGTQTQVGSKTGKISISTPTTENLLSKWQVQGNFTSVFDFTSAECLTSVSTALRNTVETVSNESLLTLAHSFLHLEKKELINYFNKWITLSDKL